MISEYDREHAHAADPVDPADDGDLVEGSLHRHEDAAYAEPRGESGEELGGERSQYDGEEAGRKPMTSPSQGWMGNLVRR